MHLITCQCLLTCVCFVLQEQDSLFRFIALELCQATLHEVGLVAIEFIGPLYEVMFIESVMLIFNSTVCGRLEI